MASNGERWDRIERGIEHLLESVARHDVQIAGLTERHQHLEGAVERLRQTDERLRQTDERVNALVGIVDSIVRRLPPPAPA